MRQVCAPLGEHTTLAKSLVMARIYEVFPFACPICHAEMRIIAFVTDASTIQKILGHIGEPTQPPTISPARGPLLWEAAMTAKEVDNNHQYDLAARPAPEFQFDQRISCVTSNSPHPE